MGAPEENRAVEQEKKLQFDDMNDALVYIAEKWGNRKIGKPLKKMCIRVS